MAVKNEKRLKVLVKQIMAYPDNAADRSICTNMERYPNYIK